MDCVETFKQWMRRNRGDDWQMTGPFRERRYSERHPGQQAILAHFKAAHPECSDEVTLARIAREYKGGWYIYPDSPLAQLL